MIFARSHHRAMNVSLRSTGTLKTLMNVTGSPPTGLMSSLTDDMLLPPANLRSAIGWSFPAPPSAAQPGTEPATCLVVTLRRFQTSVKAASAGSS